jgi:general secretion pathway protein C
MKDGRPAGYTVMPRGGQGAAILAQVGLAPGDVLLTIDGSELSRERLSELPSILAAADRVDVTYERGGQTLTTTLRMTPP